MKKLKNGYEHEPRFKFIKPFIEEDLMFYFGEHDLQWSTHDYEVFRTTQPVKAIWYARETKTTGNYHIRVSIRDSTTPKEVIETFKWMMRDLFYKSTSRYVEAKDIWYRLPKRQQKTEIEPHNIFCRLSESHRPKIDKSLVLNYLRSIKNYAAIDVVNEKFCDLDALKDVFSNN